MAEYDLMLMFNKSTGSDRIFYFLMDPRSKHRMFPKMNTTIFPKLRNLVCYRPVVLGGSLYIIGGKDWATGHCVGHTWKYSTESGKWTACASLKEPRCRFTADVLDGKIYVTGGELSTGQVTDQVECYDPAADSWTPIKAMPRPRVDHASCASGHRLYVSGGISNLKHQCSDVFWTYDVLTNQWTEPCPDIQLPDERDRHIMVPHKHDFIYILSGRGFDQDMFQEKDEAHVYSYTTKYDGTGRRHRPWDTDHPHMVHPRVNCGYIALGISSEFLSWRKNKTEDHRLAQVKQSVDNHMQLSRKTHHQEKELLNKDITHNICKVTPTTDEYLGRTYHRYSAWRAREKERLDRRYRGLYKTYLREYSALNIQHAPVYSTRRAKTAYTPKTNEETEPDVVETMSTDEKPPETSTSEEVSVTTEPLSTDTNETLSVENYSQDLYRRRLSGTFAALSAFQSSPSGRRCSAGSVPLPKDVLEKLKQASLLPQLNEDDSSSKSKVSAPRPKPSYAGRRKSTGTVGLPKAALLNLAKAGYLPQVSEDGIDEPEARPLNRTEEGEDHPREATDIVPPMNKSRRASVAVASGIRNEMGAMNRSRRASIAVTPATNGGVDSINRTRRGSLVPSMNNGVTDSERDTVPRMGKRLSRRPSMPTMAIPTTFN